MVAYCHVETKHEKGIMDLLMGVPDFPTQPRTASRLSGRKVNGELNGRKEDNKPAGACWHGDQISLPGQDATNRSRRDGDLGYRRRSVSWEESHSGHHSLEKREEGRYDGRYTGGLVIPCFKLLTNVTS